MTEEFLITAINEQGKRFTLKFESPYIFKQKLRKMKRSKKVEITFHSDIPG